MAKEMLVTTTEKIPGHNYEVLGEVFGVTTQSKNVFSNIGAGLKNVVGGEIKAYTKCCMNRVRSQLPDCARMPRPKVLMPWS